MSDESICTTENTNASIPLPLIVITLAMKSDGIHNCSRYHQGMNTTFFELVIGCDSPGCGLSLTTYSLTFLHFRDCFLGSTGTALLATQTICAQGSSPRRRQRSSSDETSLGRGQVSTHTIRKQVLGPGYSSIQTHPVPMFPTLITFSDVCIVANLPRQVPPFQTTFVKCPRVLDHGYGRLRRARCQNLVFNTWASRQL